MTRTSLFALAATMLAALAGCSSTNRLMGHNITERGRWYGELGITGHLNNLTVEAGSQITKLSIIGDGNEVTFEERCTLGKIELWGDNNTIKVPEHLVVRISQVGPGNRVIRYTPGAKAPAPQPPAETAPENYEQTAFIEVTPADEPVEETAEEDLPTPEDSPGDSE